MMKLGNSLVRWSGKILWPGPDRVILMSPWLQLSGGVLAFLSICLFSAIYSELGAPLTTGESPLFSIAKAHGSGLLVSSLGSLLLILGVQYLAVQRSLGRYPLILRILAGIELASVGMVGTVFVLEWQAILAWAHGFLQVSIILQVFTLVQWSTNSDSNGSTELLDLETKGCVRFLFFLFVLAGLTGFLDPSQRQSLDYTQMSGLHKVVLARLFPPILSGITGLWFGAIAVIVLSGLKLMGRMPIHSSKKLLSFSAFVAISGLYAVIFLSSLVSATHWELDGFELKSAVVPLLVLLAGGGGALSYVVFQRLAALAPNPTKKSGIAMLGLCLGALLVLPMTGVRNCTKKIWVVILCWFFAVAVAFEFFILFGNLFNPWFTVFSYLKGAFLKVTTIVAAGVLVLLLDELSPVTSKSPSHTWRGIAALGLASFLPFHFFSKIHDVKAVILTYGEMSMVNATYAREFFEVLGIARWMPLGQSPKTNGETQPWPPPWTLKKTHPSLLPKDFNIIVIVVDALRGDAFGSAGYQRNLTPFLDAWGRKEAFSFRRAYSQGGGTFAAFPFLVGGRSDFGYYGPDLYRENLYFQIAQAEGIKKVMIVQNWPRSIFPPDYPVIALGGSQLGKNQRSVAAGEAFSWAQKAFEDLKEGDRFLAFLHLMDVHNDLWKKKGGRDFGDGPRDLYDNNLSYVDKAFERFVEWLKEKGIYQRTVIVFTSDHGEQFWEHGASLHGHSLFEEDIRIPLMVYIPGILGRVENVPVVAADMVPTIAELAGYSVFPSYDDPHMGISLLPILFGGGQDRYLNRDVVGMASFKRRYFLYRNWRWKLVYSADFDFLQLFDLAKDPGERKNLVIKRSKLAAEMEKELFKYLKKVERKSYRPLLSNCLYPGKSDCG